jgi:hypothetical protein
MSAARFAGLLINHDGSEQEVTQPIVAIPAELVDGLREGVYRELCCVAESLTEAVQSSRHPDVDLYQWYGVRVVAACGLLGRIGWSSQERVDALGVDVAREGMIVVASLRFAREAFIEELDRSVEESRSAEVPALATKVLSCTERLSILEPRVSGANDHTTGAHG